MAGNEQDATATGLSEVHDIVLFRTRAEVLTEEVVHAATRFGRLVQRMPGFVARELSVDRAGRWLDQTRWMDGRSAEGAAHVLPGMEAAREYHALMDPNGAVVLRLRAVLGIAAAPRLAPVCLESARLHLRPVAEGDRSSLARLWRSCSTGPCRFGADPLTHGRVEQLMDEYLRDGGLTPPYVWVATLKHNQEPVACAGLLPRAIGGRELALVVDPELLNRGIATELGRALLDWAWGPLGLSEVHACVDADDEASARVLGKLGFWPTEQRRHASGWRRTYRLARPVTVVR